MNNDSTQQLSSQGNTGKDERSSLLAAASDFARSMLESIQTLAGTTTCKNDTAEPTPCVIHTLRESEQLILAHDTAEPTPCVFE